MEFYLSLKDGEYGRCVINYNLKTGGSTLFKPLMQQSWMKGYVWNEAMQQITPNLQVMHNPPQNSLNEILHHQTSMYCIVDASWKSPVEKAGIGLVLIQ